MKNWGFFIVLLFVTACSAEEQVTPELVEPIEPIASETSTTTPQPVTVETETETDVAGDESEELFVDYGDIDVLRGLIDNMYDWQSYYADYRFTYEIDEIENYNLIETQYVASPEQVHTIITTPYFTEQFYAMEDVGVFSKDDYEERWEYDEDTSLALENELSYSTHLLQTILDVTDEITVTQDIDGPEIANIVFSEEADLFETFRYFLAARTETIQEIMYANVVDVTYGGAFVCIQDGEITCYNLYLEVTFEDFSQGALIIREDFDRINAIPEIELPSEVYAG